jgi:hypothetical protein
MFEVGATMVSVSIRDAVPMLVAPVFLPVDAMPAPPAPSSNQLDGRRGAKLDRGQLGRERSACADAAKAMPSANARINARIYVSITNV